MGQHRNRSTTGSAPGPSTGTDGLSSLLETEREITAELERADEEATAIVAAARTRAHEMEQDFQTSLAAELRDLEVAREAETAAAVARAADEARTHVQRLDEVPEARVRELAASVLQDFLGLAPASGAPA